MELIVNRVLQTKRSTTGRLSIEDASSLVTLEPPKVPNLPPDGNGFVCITAGTYPLTIRWSDKWQKPMPHVEDVPGRTAIELHVGNFPRDTDGCCLIGLDFGGLEDYISQSNGSFSSLMAILYRGATLVNPNAPAQEQIWNVGTITYNNPE